MRRALAFDRAHGAALYLLGLTLLDTGKAGEARQCFAEALQSQRQNAGLQHALGRAAEGEGDLAAAGDAYREALRLRPDDSVFRQALASLT